MSAINYGNANHVKASLNVNNDTILFSNGQVNALSLSGMTNTVTFGKGNNDAVTLKNAGDNKVTIGNGNGDAATITAANIGNSQFNIVTVGDGKNDTAAITSGQDNNITLGNGNHDKATITGGIGNRVTMGDGSNDAVTVRNTDVFRFPTVTLGKGHGNSVTVSNGAAAVQLGAPGDTVILTNSYLYLGIDDAMVFLTSNNEIALRATGTQFNIGPGTGNTVLPIVESLADPQSTIFDFKHGAGGFKSAASVLSALQPDGSGGTLLSFGPGSSLDIRNFAPDQLSAANFKIG